MRTFQERNVVRSSRVDVRAEVVGFLHCPRGRVVGGKHDVAALEAAGLAHEQLSIAGAVNAAALLLQNLQQVGVGRGLDGKVFLEALVPAERGVDPAGIFPDTLFVIEVERGGNIGGDLLRWARVINGFFCGMIVFPFPLYAFSGRQKNAFFPYCVCRGDHWSPINLPQQRNFCDSLLTRQTGTGEQCSTLQVVF